MEEVKGTVEAEENQEVVDTPPPVQTPEEQMEALKTQATEANERAKIAEATAEEKTKGFKSIQRQLEESKRAGVQSSSQGMANALKSTISVVESQLAGGDEVTPATRAKMAEAKRQLADIETQAQYEKQESITNGVVTALRGELEDAGVDPDDSQCDGIWDAVKIAKMDNGNFDSAKNRAARVIKNAKPKEETKEVKPEVKPVEEELPEDDPRVQKAMRKALENKGLLKNTDGSPSASSSPDDEFLAKFNTGELDSPEDMKRAQEILNKLK